VQICHVLSLQLVRGEAPGVQPQTGHPPQPSRQPGQVTVTDEIVVRQTEGAQSVHVLEHVFAERRQVVVVQGPGTWNMCSVRLCNLCSVKALQRKVW
jgi:hypothetical protein